ncbi:hypothetical protein OC845_002345 [Tilletia horrida]|nr:hypothetical protein OC845_002345 [Tilletia horrida]
MLALVIGASRGIGRELALKLAADQQAGAVFGTVRKAQDIPGIETLLYDLSEPANDQKLIDALAAHGASSLDLVVVNAAIGEDEKILTTSDQRLRDYLETNLIAPTRAVKALLPLLRKSSGKQIVFISSTSGSLTKQIGATTGFCGPYSVTKAALNMVAVQLHNELVSERFTVVTMHPGWVATDMGNLAIQEDSDSRPIPVEESAAGLSKVIRGLTPESSASFLDYTGARVPW